MGVWFAKGSHTHRTHHPYTPIPAVVMTPLAVRKAALHSTRQLLSRMQLAGYASAILHPLLRVLDGPAEELRRETLDTVLSLSVALGSDFVIFIPTIRKVCRAVVMPDAECAACAECAARRSSWVAVYIH